MAGLHLPIRRATVTTRQLFLALSLGERRYVMPARQVAVVLADQLIAPLDSVPAWVGGLLTYRRMPVPIIDLVARVTGRASEPGRARRIVLLRGDDFESMFVGLPTASNLIGVWAEDVTETLMLDTAAFVPSGLQFPEARFLGPIVWHGDGWLQRLEVADLLEPDVRALLSVAIDLAADHTALRVA